MLFILIGIDSDKTISLSDFYGQTNDKKVKIFLIT